MARRLASMVILAALLTISCAPKAPPPPPPPPVKAEPGSKIISPAEDVFKALDCANKPLPYLVLETNTLTPNPAKPGAELHHHLVYAFCPAPGAKPETGTLTRSIRYKGKTVFTDVTKSFPVSPGRVTVDAFVTVPNQADPGTYIFGLDYRSDAEVKKRKTARTRSLDADVELVLTR